MTDNVRFSVLRRKLLAGLGTAAIGGRGLPQSVGAGRTAAARESKSGAVVPWILAFEVNDSLLNIRHLAPLFERLFGGGKLVKRTVYAADPLLGSNNIGRGTTHNSLIYRRPC